MDTTRITTDKRGLVSIATTVIIFGAALALALSVQFLGIGELEMGFGSHQSEQAFEAADSCTNEALLRLTRNSAYTGGSLSVGTASCTITVSGSGGTRTVQVQATVGQAVRKITVGITISGSTVTITSWQEDLT